MEIELGYGKEKIRVQLPDNSVRKRLKPKTVETEGAEEERIREGLEYSIGAPPLEEIVKSGEKVVIVTSDITRPMPTARVLPLLVEKLNRIGVPNSNILVIFAMGIHRPHKEEEKRYLLGPLYGKIESQDSDPQDCVRLGYTENGTPIDIYRRVLEGDRLICLGNIEYHYFAGYSGGMKAIMPGVSSREAIQANHSHMVEESARAGEMEINPVRKDIEEVYRYCPVDYLVNVVLDESKNILKLFAGDVFLAHREGCKFLDSLYKVELEEEADIVITTPGGYPKDINLYQAQKALDNAKYAVKKGGIIIFVAACSEGWGEPIFEEWILNASSPQDLIDRIKRDFVLGGHKAAAIALVRERVEDIYLVSDFPPSIVEKIFMKPFQSVEEAVARALEVKGEGASIIVMPYGGSTLPIL